MSDETIKLSDCFVQSTNERRPQAFIQWKGTDVCMDFRCECGADCHFDGYFAYAMKCPHCNTIWEMPCLVYPRKADHSHIDTAILMEADEEFEEPQLALCSCGRPPTLHYSDDYDEWFVICSTADCKEVKHAQARKTKKEAIADWDRPRT